MLVQMQKYSKGLRHILFPYLHRQAADVKFTKTYHKTRGRNIPVKLRLPKKVFRIFKGELDHP